MRPNDEFSAIFACLSPPFLAIYYAFAFLFEEKFSQLCIRNDKKLGSHRWMLQRILQQNASHFVSKRIAICTKTQCILHQNAVQYAPKCKVKCYKTEVKCCKMQPKPIKYTILSVIYRHFDHLE